MTVDVTETISQTVHPAFQLVRQHHVEALDNFRLYFIYFIF